MATTTFSPAHVGIEVRGVEARSVQTRQGHGLLRRIFDHMVKAREAEARRQTARALWTYSDDSLKNLGLTREELARWHAGPVD